jgi:hypothetical protein
MRAAERPEFAEIPAEVRERCERGLRLQAFEILHAEAVERGDLGLPPATRFDGAAGRLLTILFALALGALLGSVAVMAVLFSIRALAAIF